MRRKKAHIKDELKALDLCCTDYDPIRPYRELGSIEVINGNPRISLYSGEWADFHLTTESARELRDWLTKFLDSKTAPQETDT